MPESTLLEIAVEEYLAALDETDWRALVARVRPPDERIREAEKVINGNASR
jgi:hypothetical protein